MEEHDDWKLGDEGDDGACARCGKRNRPGLSHCVICGSRLSDELESAPESLRTIGETMGRPRRGTGPRKPRSSLRAWTVAAVLLLSIVTLLTWLETREEPFRFEDLMSSAAPTPPPATPVPTAVATRVPRPTAPPVATPVVVPTPVYAAVPPPLPTVERATPQPRRTARPKPRPRPTRVRVVPPPEAVPEPVVEPTPVEARPQIEATERPSLGSDLQEATRAYRHAVDVHNERVDEYNGLADEIQRRGAWDDRADSVELRRRLERARDAVEGARIQAELQRTRMESIRARYR